MQPNETPKCCFGGHLDVFIFGSCSCCPRRTPIMRCVFANATSTGGRATARSHEIRSRGVVLSCRVRWHTRGGMCVPYHARAPQQREQEEEELHDKTRPRRGKIGKRPSAPDVHRNVAGHHRAHFRCSSRTTRQKDHQSGHGWVAIGCTKKNPKFPFSNSLI